MFSVLGIMSDFNWKLDISGIMLWDTESYFDIFHQLVGRGRGSPPYHCWVEAEVQGPQWVSVDIQVGDGLDFCSFFPGCEGHVCLVVASQVASTDTTRCASLLENGDSTDPIPIGRVRNVEFQAIDVVSSDSTAVEGTSCQPGKGRIIASSPSHFASSDEHWTIVFPVEFG